MRSFQAKFVLTFGVRLWNNGEQFVRLAGDAVVVDARIDENYFFISSHSDE